MSFDSPDDRNKSNSDDDQSRRRIVKKKKKDKDKGYKMFEADASEGEANPGDDGRSPAIKLKKHSLSFKFSMKKESGIFRKDKDDKTTDKERSEMPLKLKESLSVKSSKKREGGGDTSKPPGRKHKKEPASRDGLARVHSDHFSAAVSASPQQQRHPKPIFGVPLAVAVERHPPSDGIQLPVIVRECIDYVEEHGLLCEGIYRVSGVKSKVQQLRDAYNRLHTASSQAASSAVGIGGSSGSLASGGGSGGGLCLYEHDPSVVASLLKQFLRELPEPVLTGELMPSFEEAAAAASAATTAASAAATPATRTAAAAAVTIAVQKLKTLIGQLPACNRLLLSWMMVHMMHVVSKEKINKMSVQNVSIVLSPTMQISHRVLNAFFIHSGALFGDVCIIKYVPAEKAAAGSSSSQNAEGGETTVAMEEELRQQEALLSRLHALAMQSGGGASRRHRNDGGDDVEERLWEVQRSVTQLKRKLKLAQKTLAARELEQQQQQQPESAAVGGASQSAVVPPLASAAEVPEQVAEARAETEKRNELGVPTREPSQQAAQGMPEADRVPMPSAELQRESGGGSVVNARVAFSVAATASAMPSLPEGAADRGDGPATAAVAAVGDEKQLDVDSADEKQASRLPAAVADHTLEPPADAASVRLNSASAAAAAVAAAVEVTSAATAAAASVIEVASSSSAGVTVAVSPTAAAAMAGSSIGPAKLGNTAAATVAVSSSSSSETVTAAGSIEFAELTSSSTSASSSCSSSQAHTAATGREEEEEQQHSEGRGRTASSSSSGGRERLVVATPGCSTDEGVSPVLASPLSPDVGEPLPAAMTVCSGEGRTGHVSPSDVGCALPTAAFEAGSRQGADCLIPTQDLTPGGTIANDDAYSANVAPPLSAPIASLEKSDEDEASLLRGLLPAAAAVPLQPVPTALSASGLFASGMLLPQKLHREPPPGGSTHSEHWPLLAGVDDGEEAADDEELHRLIAEEARLMWEEEELLAIRDELRQKIATEQLEAERLRDEIAEYEELRSIRHRRSSSSSAAASSDSDGCKDAAAARRPSSSQRGSRADTPNRGGGSSSSSSDGGGSAEDSSSDEADGSSSCESGSNSSGSSDSEDTDDLLEQLERLEVDNRRYEEENSSMVQKIHEERLVCLDVKLQIRLLQQQQLGKAAHMPRPSLL